MLTEIRIKGAKVHNLKNIDVTIPHNKLVVITGLSGSGKSSLAYDTLYAEGQRRYVESLSSYARQFMGKMHKPEVDQIQGIAPAVAIEQKVITRSSRSTVGTSTEIYDYLKLLFARIGKTISPISGQVVKKHSVSDVTRFIQQKKNTETVTILSPIQKVKNLHETIQLLQKQGFSRVELNNEIFRISDLLESRSSSLKRSKAAPAPASLFLVIDRIALNQEDENDGRIADSVQTAFYEGDGHLTLKFSSSDSEVETLQYQFSNRFELDGLMFEEPSVQLFSFNNPVGACRTCDGFGSIIGIDERLVVPNPNLSVFEEAVACWKGEKMSKWKDKLIKNAHHFNFPVHRPYNQLKEEEKQILWKGNEYFDGLDEFFRFLEQESFKIQYRVMLSRYRGKTTCPECKGSRLRKESEFVRINGLSIGMIVSLQAKDALTFFERIELEETEQKIASRLLTEIRTRLKFLVEVGLGYLTLHRLSNTLSGGESQRINLSTSLGSSLVGSMYILDEPSIGLHPQDTQKLIRVLKSLRDIGNSVIVVEHDDEIIQSSDEIIDMGPGAGRNGGEIVFQGEIHSIQKSKQPAHSLSHTLNYLSGIECIPVPSKRRKWKNFIEIKGARENNLKNLNVKFPLGVLTAVSGVSGSGKTSLVKKTLQSALKRHLGIFSDDAAGFDRLSGDLHLISSVEVIDQNPIGKSSRSNPVTYIKAYDEIRNLFASLPLSKSRGYKPSTFSFNVDGGRCETCEGEGEVTIEMQFMADVHLECESCKGTRFKEEILEIEFNNKNIADILGLTIDEAVEFFANENRINHRLKVLQEVGMGYIKLGQSSSTLSGGEAQRVKLASFLIGNKHGERSEGRSFFIFDEPTTGLHQHDIRKLLYSLNRLVDEGHSVVVIEHNMDVIKCADHVIDLGPEGGNQGGELLFEGTPEGLAKCKESITGKFLKKKL